MQLKLIAATISAFALVTGADSVSADSQRQGELHIVKECFDVYGPARPVLYDHFFEPRGDTGRRQGLLRPGRVHSNDPDDGHAG